MYGLVHLSSFSCRSLRFCLLPAKIVSGPSTNTHQCFFWMVAEEGESDRENIRSTACMGCFLLLKNLRKTKFQLYSSLHSVPLLFLTMEGVMHDAVLNTYTYMVGYLHYCRGKPSQVSQ